MTKLPALSAQSSMISLLGPDSPQVGLRREQLGMSKTKLNEVVNAKDIEQIAKTTTGKTVKDKHALVGSVDDFNVTAPGSQVATRAASIDDVIDLEECEMATASEAASFADHLSVKSDTLPRMKAEMATTADLFATIDPKMIHSISKTMARPTPSSSESTNSLNTTASQAMTSTNSLGIPMVLQQPLKVVPGVLNNSSRRRTKSLDEPVVTGSSSPAPASKAIRKEKAKLKMTQM